MQKTVVITGANTGIGYGILERLLSEYLSQRKLGSDATSAVFVMVCRSLDKAAAARDQLLQKYFAGNKEEGIKTIQMVKCDLSDTKSVFQAAETIRKRLIGDLASLADLECRYSCIHSLIFNAGYIPIKSISIYRGIIGFLTAPSDLAKTTGDVLVQEQGVLTPDGQYGLAFSANTLGHFILLRELEPLLEKSAKHIHDINPKDGVRVIWMTSVTVTEEFFDPKDMEGIKSKAPYECSKYVMELAHAALIQSFKEKGIYTFLASPGIVATNITQGKVPVFLVAWLLVLLRLLFISGVNVTPLNAATSIQYLVDHDTPGSLDQQKVYHSDIYPSGKRWVKLLKSGAEFTSERSTLAINFLDDIWRKEKAAKQIKA
ncbi:hypothetical protein HDU97_006718 [Phlyctochytrium planicorne]|nr:hypothetical protein HDU97_006718 [Phlyctochytrium planicorne]